MPLLGLSFEVEHDNEEMKIRGVEQTGLYVISVSSLDEFVQISIRRLLAGIEDYILLQDSEANMEVIVLMRYASRKILKGSPFYNGFLPKYASSEGKSYLVYGIHPSLAYLVMPSITARLYMIWLRLN
jgi:hypothetical protein